MARCDDDLLVVVTVASAFTYTTLADAVTTVHDSDGRTVGNFGIGLFQRVCKAHWSIGPRSNTVRYPHQWGQR